MKILLVGEPNRVTEMRTRLATGKDLEIEISDGDSEEDFEFYDVIFDLNFDDDPSNMEIYAGLKDKPVFVNAVKLQLAEALFTVEEKIRCQLFGINALSTFPLQSKWEISLYRKFQMDDLTKLMQQESAV